MNHDEAARLLGAAVADCLDELENIPQDELRAKRRAKFRFDGRLCVIDRAFHKFHRLFPCSEYRPQSA